jgi:hypothetical protein
MRRIKQQRYQDEKAWASLPRPENEYPTGFKPLQGLNPQRGPYKPTPSIGIYPKMVEVDGTHAPVELPIAKSPTPHLNERSNGNNWQHNGPYMAYSQGGNVVPLNAKHMRGFSKQQHEVYVTSPGPLSEYGGRSFIQNSKVRSSGFSQPSSTADLLRPAASNTGADDDSVSQVSQSHSHVNELDPVRRHPDPAFSSFFSHGAPSIASSQPYHPQNREAPRPGPPPASSSIISGTTATTNLSDDDPRAIARELQRVQKERQRLARMKELEEEENELKRRLDEAVSRGGNGQT